MRTWALSTVFCGWDSRGWEIYIKFPFYFRCLTSCEPNPPLFRGFEVSRKAIWILVLWKISGKDCLEQNPQYERAPIRFPIMLNIFALVLYLMIPRESEVCKMVNFNTNPTAGPTSFSCSFQWNPGPNRPWNRPLSLLETKSLQRFSMSFRY